jgi:hypothetical protein
MFSGVSRVHAIWIFSYLVLGLAFGSSLNGGNWLSYLALAIVRRGLDKLYPLVLSADLLHDIPIAASGETLQSQLRFETRLKLFKPIANASNNVLIHVSVHLAFSAHTGLSSLFNRQRSGCLSIIPPPSSVNCSLHALCLRS